MSLTIVYVETCERESDSHFYSKKKLAINMKNFVVSEVLGGSYGNSNSYSNYKL